MIGLVEYFYENSLCTYYSDICVVTIDNTDTIGFETIDHALAESNDVHRTGYSVCQGEY